MGNVRRALFVISILGSTSTVSYALTGGTLQNNINCNGGMEYYFKNVPRNAVFGSGFYFLNDIHSIADPQALTSALQEAANEVLTFCNERHKSQPDSFPFPNGVEVFFEAPPGNTAVQAWIYQPENVWHFQANNAAQTAAQIDKDSAARRAVKDQQDADAKRKSDERDQAAKMANDLQQKFQADNRLAGWSNIQLLHTNPFVAKDKVVGLRADFTQMISADEAMFGELLVDGVPNTMFSVPGQQTILAIRVEGIKNAKSPLGTDVPTPYGTYVGVYMCRQPNCAEFIGSTH